MAPFKAEAASLYSTALEDIAATPAVFPIPEAPVGETPGTGNTTQPVSNTEGKDEERPIGEKPGKRQHPPAATKTLLATTSTL